MSEFDEKSSLADWLRQPRWLDGAKQKRLFEAADKIDALRNLVGETLSSRAPDYIEVEHPGWTERARAALSK